MAVDTPVLDVTYSAGGDLSAGQFKWVTLSAARTVSLCTALTDVPAGILQNKPAAAGRNAVVRVIGRSKVLLGATLSAGHLIGPLANAKTGRKIPGTDVTHYIGGQLEEGGADTLVATALINCMAPRRAA